MKLSRHLRKRHGRHDGYMLLAIVLMLTLALIAMTVTAPYVVTQVKRDREEELIHRGKAYSNAVKRFYKRFGRYPGSLGELHSTGNMHFIRKLYKDPMTPDGEWRVIHLGEAKYFPKGFGMGNIAGASPIGGGSGGGAQVPGGLGSVFGGSASPGGSAAAQPGQPSPAVSSNQPNTSGMTPADQMSKPLGTGPTFGGGPVIGVASKNDSVGIHEVNERKKINEWEFFYDPRYDIATMMPGSAGQQVIPGQPGFGQQGGSGQGGQPGGKR